MARPLGAAQLRPLLQTLSDGAWHSGALLARDAGITRAALSKRIKKLGTMGLDIETRPGQGCRLHGPVELLEPDLIRGALTPQWRSALTLHHAFSVASTNSHLMDSDAKDDPQALVAEHQSAGRGRWGRQWHSPFGANLYLSLAWSFARWPPTLTALPLAAGVACAEALEACDFPPPQLKWPNDLLYDGRKVGGILVEQRGESGGPCRVVIGVGLNVAMRSADAISQPWTTLANQAPDQRLSRSPLAGQLLSGLCEMLQAFGTQGFTSFAARWQQRDACAGRAITVDEGQGPQTAKALGVDENGALRIESAAGRRRLLSGDIQLRVRTKKQDVP